MSSRRADIPVCRAWSNLRADRNVRPTPISPTNMTDSNSPSHWDALVLDLGATPPHTRAYTTARQPPSIPADHAAQVGTAGPAKQTTVKRAVQTGDWN